MSPISTPDLSSETMILSASTPGVFKTAQMGCAAPLKARRRIMNIDDGSTHLVEFYACASQDCDFREVLHDMLKEPKVAPEAISAEEGFQVCLHPRN